MGQYCKACRHFNDSGPCPEMPCHGVPESHPADSTDGCAHCDTFGGEKTYANQVCLPISGGVCVDWCIHQIVAALNAGGVQTAACCCGHGRQPGRIDLVDGRKIMLYSY